MNNKTVAIVSVVIGIVAILGITGYALRTQTTSTTNQNANTIAPANANSGVTNNTTQATTNTNLTVSNSPSGTDSCIITVFGKQYDVAPLRKRHPGGDIYVCGTDMTETYKGKHGTNTSRIQEYLVTN